MFYSFINPVGADLVQITPILKQNIVLQHPVVVEFPQIVDSKTTSGDPTQIQASPQSPQLLNVIPPVLDAERTDTSRQNIVPQHPIVVESPQIVNSKTTFGDPTQIQASPQSPQLQKQRAILK